MEVFLNEISLALDHKLYYLAVSTALAIPDMCSAVESADGRAYFKKYWAWYDKWLQPSYPEISNKDMYLLRCSVLHTGVLHHEGSQYSRIIFTPDEGFAAHRVVIGNGTEKKALSLDATFFCLDVIDAAERWYESEKNHPHVLANLPRLLQYRGGGLEPYIAGVPVIA